MEPVIRDMVASNGVSIWLDMEARHLHERWMRDQTRLDMHGKGAIAEKINNRWTERRVSYSRADACVKVFPKHSVNDVVEFALIAREFAMKKKIQMKGLKCPKLTSTTSK